MTAAAQSNGQIVVLEAASNGSEQLQRFNTDGSEDMNFGSSGVAPIPGKNYSVMTVGSNGDIAVGGVGSDGYGFSMSLFSSGGTLIGDGQVGTPASYGGGGSRPTGIAIEPVSGGNRVIVVGWDWAPSIQPRSGQRMGQSSDSEVAVFNGDGDPIGLNENNWQKYYDNSYLSNAVAVAAGDGYVFVDNTKSSQIYDYTNSYVSRYAPSTIYANASWLTANINGIYRAYNTGPLQGVLAVQSNGMVLTGGFDGYSGGAPVDVMQRFSPAGTPDQSFGSDGIVTTPFTILQIDPLANGQTLVLGQDDQGNYLLARYNENGSPDSNFGTDGILTSPLNSSQDSRPLITQTTGYYYEVVAVNGDGAIDAIWAAASNLTVTSISGSEIILNWSSVNIDPSVTQLSVLESPNGATDWTQVATAASNSYGAVVDTPLASETTYYFKLEETGTEPTAYSEILAVTTPEFPAAPTGLTATPESGNEVNLSWSDSADDESGFIIYRSDDDGADWEQVGQAESSQFTYSDTTALDDTPYEYEVAAENTAGNLSAFDSTTGSVTTPLNSPIALSYNVSYGNESSPYSYPIPSLDLTWGLDSGAAVTVNFEISDYSNFSTFASDSVPATQDSYSVSDWWNTPTSMIETLDASAPMGNKEFLLPGTYYVRLQSVDGSGSVSAWSSTLTANVVALPPVEDPVTDFGGGNPVVGVLPIANDLAWYSDAPNYYTVVSPPSHGSLDPNTDGDFTYTPDAGYNGPDQFSYTVTDSLTGLTSQACVAEFDDVYAAAPPSIVGATRQNFGWSDAVDDGFVTVSTSDILSHNPADFVLVADNLMYTEDPANSMDDMDYNSFLLSENGGNFPNYTLPSGNYFQPNFDMFYSTLGTSYSQMTVSLSDWSCVRMYDGLGELLTPTELSSGDWTGLVSSGDSDVFVEGIAADPDLQVTVTISSNDPDADPTLSQTFDMAVIEPTVTDTSGDTLSGASFLPEEELVAATVANSDDDPVVQALAQDFQSGSLNAEFNITLNGIPASDVQELLVNGQQIPVTDVNGSAETTEPLLLDAGSNLSSQEVQTLDTMIGGYVVPEYAQIELITTRDNVTLTLPTAIAGSSSDDSGGDSGGGVDDASDGSFSPATDQANNNTFAADFFLDGTGNDANTDRALGTETNVWLMEDADSGTYWNNSLHRYYLYGVGTETDPIQGLVNGVGADDIIAKAMEYFVKAVQAGANTIDVVGFSRGATEALEFLNEIDDALNNGTVPKLDAVGEQTYIEVSENDSIVDIPVKFGHANINIRFVGLFDPVASYGGLTTLGSLFAPTIRTTLPNDLPIQTLSEAIAVDEHRKFFQLTPVSNPGDITNFVQLGFIGAHSDVGGGYGESDGISNTTLHWMMGQAESAGMTFSDQYSNLSAPYQISGEAHDSYVAPSGKGYAAITRTFPADLNVLIPQDLVTKLAFLLYDPSYDVFTDTAPFSSFTPALHVLIDPNYNLPEQFPNGWIGSFIPALIEQTLIWSGMLSTPEKVF